MPKYKVTKCVDAFVNYEAIVEAENAKEARRIAEEEDSSLTWTDGGTSEFDDTDYDNIEPELLDEE